MLSWQDNSIFYKFYVDAMVKFCVLLIDSHGLALLGTRHVLVEYDMSC